MAKNLPLGSQNAAASRVPAAPSNRLTLAGQRISCLSIPAFEQGKLPPGEHPVSWPDLVMRFGGPTVKRRLITEGLKTLALMLRGAGAKWLFVDGSYATMRERPGDWDGCFLEDGLDWNAVDPLLRDIQRNRVEIAKKYWCDVFVANHVERTTRKPFREFFQQTSGGKPKGILVLDLETVK